MRKDLHLTTTDLNEMDIEKFYFFVGLINTIDVEEQHRIDEMERKSRMKSRR
jgi:hypothetical protein